MLSTALGPPPVFMPSEKVIAIWKLSALEDMTVGFAVSAVALVPKLKTYVEEAPFVVLTALATPPLPSSPLPERSATAVPAVRVYVVLVERPAVGVKCA